MSGSAFAVTHHAFSSGAGRTSDGNGSHASTLKSPSYTKSVSWQHYPQVEATRKSVLAGQRVNVDVLNAEQQLYGAQRDLAEAKYTYIKAWISLLSDSGTLNEKNISHVASYFAQQRN